MDSQSLVGESQIVEHKQSKKHRACMSHEKSGSQWLVRTGQTNRAFRYGGPRSLYTSEAEAKKKALESVKKQDQVRNPKATSRRGAFKMQRSKVTL